MEKLVTYTSRPMRIGEVMDKLNTKFWYSTMQDVSEEDYSHYVWDPVTDLDLHPNSSGYRLILNNILFPAAKKEKRKT